MAKMTTDHSIAGLNRRLARLPKTAKVRLRQGSAAIAERVATDAAELARRVGGVLALVAPSFKATKDGVPTVKMGGTTKLPAQGPGWTHSRAGDRQTLGDAMWGAEFGGGKRARTPAGGSTLQFMQWRGSSDGAGYAMWPAVRQDREYIQDTYSEELRRAEQDI